MDHAGDATQFIVRAAELARLDAAVSRAVEGKGGTVIVGGEAGIGKTRLLERFAGRADGEGTLVLGGACLEFGGRGVPFVPFVEAFRTLARSVEPARLPALLGPGRRGLASLLPELDERRVETDGGREFDRYAQARLFEAVLDVIERLASSTPVIFIVEDIQWADEDTRDLLSFLARHLRKTRVLMILSVRTDDLDRHDPTLRFLGEIERDDGVDRLELQTFGRDELAEVLSTENGGFLTAELLDDVFARSGGNPFYAEQLLAMVQAGGTELPPRLRDVLLGRFAGLSSVAQDLVRAAAAAGPRFDDELLESVLDAPIAEIEDALREAIEAGILMVVHDSGDHPGYAFRHALLREVAYGQLVAGERVRLHATFARRLLQRQDDGVDRAPAGELANHLDAARDYRRAVPALVQAGAEAEHAYAFGVARRHYERALELWDQAGPAAESDGHDRAFVMQRAAECSELLGAHARAIELGRDAIALLAQAERPDRVRLGALHDRLRWYLWEAGDAVAAEAAVVEALRLIPDDPPSAARARALGQAAGLRMTAGDLEAASELAHQALDRAVGAHAPAEEAFARGVLGWCQAVSGDVDRGIATYRQGLAIAERIGGPEGIALGQANLAAMLDRVGRTGSSLAAAIEGYEIVKRLGVSRTYGGILLGHACKGLFDLGRWREAVDIADEGLDLDPVGVSATWLHVNHARLDTNQGRYVEAAVHLDRARELGEAAGPSNRYGLALLAAEADLARWQGRLEDVRAAVDEGIRSILEDRQLDPALGWLAAHGLRAEADAALTARAHHDAVAIEAAEERAGRIIGLTNRLSSVPVTAADGRREAISALCRAEAARLRDEADPSSWEVVAQRWEALDRPYPAAYAWFRTGEAVLRTRGSRAVATKALLEANRTVVALGARPLQGNIELLARHARISLEEHVLDGRQSPDRLGLTERESEVLGLVAAGWSNQQIADALFITRKTASVHVSNILGKFGVRNRVEAAAIAHRLGLVGRVGSPPADA